MAESIKKASVKSNKSSASQLIMKDNDSIKLQTDSQINKISNNKMLEDALNRIFAFGSAECDQFEVPGEFFESRRPVEIPFFSQLKIRICSITCGGQHTVVLSDKGEVYTWGNADTFALGRPGHDRTPQVVPLPYKVNLIAAGDCYTVVANSPMGRIHFWGGFVSLTHGQVYQREHPTEVEHYYIRRNGIKYLSGGANHIIVLSATRAFTWGDSESGALATVFAPSIAKKKKIEPEAVGIRSVIKIFATHYGSFFLTKKKVYACGLNGFNQLGMYTREEFKQIKSESSDVLLEKKPMAVPGLDPQSIQQIVGGESYTIILDTQGQLFGSGKNDDGQLGNVDENHTLGNFSKISHVPPAKRLFASSHFNYALDKEKIQYYAWGFGASYVLGNGKEESLESCYAVSNEKLFKGEPSKLALGHSHIVFSLGHVFEEEELTAQLFVEKKRLPRSSYSRNKNLKKVNI